MTKKDFELIAEVIATLPESISYNDQEQVAAAFADRLATTNPRFDRDRFMDAAMSIDEDDNE